MLYHKSVRSFEELRTIDGTLHETLEKAARTLGIVSGNEEYGLCMQEASIYRTAKQLRGFFVTLINHGAPAKELWQAFEADLTEDISPLVQSESPSTIALRDIDFKL